MKKKRKKGKRERSKAASSLHRGNDKTSHGSKPISIATRAGRRRRPLGSDDGSKGTLLFDSRKDGRGEWKDGRSAGGANCWTWRHYSVRGSCWRAVNEPRWAWNTQVGHGDIAVAVHTIAGSAVVGLLRRGAGWVTTGWDAACITDVTLVVPLCWLWNADA